MANTEICECIRQGIVRVFHATTSLWKTLEDFELADSGDEQDPKEIDEENAWANEWEEEDSDKEEEEKDSDEEEEETSKKPSSPESNDGEEDNRKQPAKRRKRPAANDSDDEESPDEEANEENELAKIVGEKQRIAKLHYDRGEALARISEIDFSRPRIGEIGQWKVTRGNPHIKTWFRDERLASRLPLVDTSRDIPFEHIFESDVICVDILDPKCSWTKKRDANHHLDILMDYSLDDFAVFAPKKHKDGSANRHHDLILKRRIVFQIYWHALKWLGNSVNVRFQKREAKNRDIIYQIDHVEALKLIGERLELKVYKRRQAQDWGTVH